MHTNEQFIKALNRKKEEAFQMLFKDYYASLVMYAMHYVRQEVAEDIVQDLMTLLWEKDTYFDSISAFHSSTSSTNCRNAVRKYSNYTWPGKKKMKLPHNSAFPSQRLKATNRRHFNV